MCFVMWGKKWKLQPVWFNCSYSQSETLKMFFRNAFWNVRVQGDFSPLYGYQPCIDLQSLHSSPYRYPSHPRRPLTEQSEKACDVWSDKSQRFHVSEAAAAFIMHRAMLSKVLPVVSFSFFGDVTKLWNKMWMRELNKIKNSWIKRNDSSYLRVHMWNGFTQLAWRAKVQIWRFEVWVINWRQWIQIWWVFFMRLIGALHFNFLLFSFSSCWSN